MTIEMMILVVMAIATLIGVYVLFSGNAPNLDSDAIGQDEHYSERNKGW